MIIIKTQVVILKTAMLAIRYNNNKNKNRNNTNIINK